MGIVDELTQWRAMSSPELMALALRTKLANRGCQFSLCSIINAKSGQCSEDCRFCAQSAHFTTGAPVYPLLDKAQVLSAAWVAKKNGAGHFSLVTSGRGLKGRDLAQVAVLVEAIRQEVDIAVCASLGILNRQDFVMLKEAGMSRYHHNLESSESFFPRIATTHTFAERVDTILAAKEAGLEVCAGGIFGLGETEDDRLSMALTLRSLDVDSVPINVLIPLPGTPLADQHPISVFDILRSIALYRLLLPAIPLRLAAGRETALQDFLSSAFLAGADGMMIGGYLTEKGRLPEMDLRFVQMIRELWQG
ncbi:MAG: biotin synthase BioB [Desulfobulbaceae bacterium]|nr:biotin synthase BioB [Desulfobulbaceae bacterium]